MLGRVDPASVLGGDFRLDVAAARAAIQTHLAGPLGTTIEEAALTVRRVANALMAQAMRLVTVERGYDPREFIYIPFGGAGPVHAVDLAREIEIPTVVLPPMPGLFSAFGMLVADMVQDYQAPVVRNTDDADPDRIAAQFTALEAEARQTMSAAGIAEADLAFERRADCCYLGQGDTIPVAVPMGGLGADDLAAMARDFETEHHRRWNFSLRDRPVRIVNLRLRVAGRIGRFATSPVGQRSGGAPEPVGRARIYDAGTWVEMPLYRRDDLCEGDVLQGPLVVEELSTRLSLAAGDSLRVGADGAIIVTLGRS